MNIHKGEQYAIPFYVKVGDAVVTPENCDGIRIQIDGKLYEYPDSGLQYDDSDDTWLYPLTESQSSVLMAGERNAQVAVKYGNDIIMSDIVKITVKDSIIKRRWAS